MLFRNHYHCTVIRNDKPCNTQWTDIWDCTCDDRCPECNTAISPHHSDELCEGCKETKDTCLHGNLEVEEFDCPNEG